MLKGEDLEQPRLQVCLRRDWANLWKMMILESGIWNFFKKRIKLFENHLLECKEAQVFALIKNALKEQA